jgi:hypothetical protein
MDDFLAVTLSFPTVVFTVMLGVALVYWTMVIVGALGMDALDVDTGHGAAEGALHGHAHVDAGGADGGVDAHGHADGQHHELGAIASFMSALKLTTVPMTIVLSLVFFWGWLLSLLGSRYALGTGGVLGGWLGGAIVLAFAFTLAWPLTSLVVRPLAPLFKFQEADRRESLVGKIVTIDSSTVDANFGVAKHEDGGAGLIVHVRSDAKNGLTRGMQAIVVSYDDEHETYEVAPVEDFLPDRGRA